MSVMTQDEFVRRFTTEAIRIAGFEVFDDGMPVSEYCAEVASSYYSDPLLREDGPEACAESDVSYWGEE